MIGVEVPDYSGILTFVCIVIAVASVAVTLTRSESDSKMMRLLNLLSLNWRKGVTRGNHMYCSGRAARYAPMCGYVRGGLDAEWKCNCGKAKCESAGAPDATPPATPPVHPKPDRRAAVEHSRNK
jgi:hypothetical protein